MKPKLVDDWKQAHKWFSVQCLALAGAINGAWAAIPAEMQATIPQDWITYATIALMVLGTLGRVVDQP